MSNQTIDDFTNEIGNAFSGAEINTDDDFESQESEVESTPEATITETTPPVTTEDSSLKTDAAPVTSDEAPTTEVKVETTPTKSFDELLAERTGGKFNKWEEIESTINSPKDDFYDDDVRRINELKKQGVNLDRQWFEMQTRDYENMEDPAEILAEAMKIENPKLTDKEIAYEIRSKYQLDKWIKEDQDEDDITPEQRELEEIMSIKMVREAEEKRDELIKRRDAQSWKVPKNPETEAKAIAEAKAMQESWEKNVDEVNSNFSKLTNSVSEKEAFDYVLDESEKKDVSNMMKQMGSNANVFWNQFVKDGKIDQQKVYETIVKSRNYDKAVVAAYQKGLATGQEQEVKNLKNIDFKGDSKPTSHAPNDWSTAFAESVFGKRS
jgi:hypothetical protein